jgi:hypothetical protein
LFESSLKIKSDGECFTVEKSKNNALIEKKLEVDVVVHTYNPSTQKAETGGS